MALSSTSGSPRVVRVGERLVIVGTVHVDPSSVQEARNTIRDVNPSVVALELDQGRLNALVQRESGSAKARRSWTGLSILLLGLLERVAGQLTGSMPGKEMLGAAEEAGWIGARIALIDMPIDRTVVLLRKIPVAEKVKLGMDSVASLVLLGFGFSSIGGSVGAGLEELSTGGETLAHSIGSFRKRYPAMSRLLIDTREQYMVERIGQVLDGSTGRVVAVVGLGHMTSLSRRLEKHLKGRAEMSPAGYNVGATWTVST